MYPLPFSQCISPSWPEETFRERWESAEVMLLMWVYCIADGQTCSDGGSQAYHLVSAGSHGRPDCGRRLSQTFSACSQPVYHQSANQPRLNTSRPTPLLVKDARLGVYHMSPIYQRFTTEDDTEGEMIVALEWREKDGWQIEKNECMDNSRLFQLIFIVLADRLYSSMWSVRLGSMTRSQPKSKRERNTSSLTIRTIVNKLTV